jgi:hypothetical protein
MAEELEFKKANQKTRMIAIGGIVAIAVVVVAVFALGGSTDVSEYSLGSPCTSDCGRFEMDGWVCLEQQKYCTFPCGGINRSCSEGFECKEVAGAPARSEGEGGEKKPMYCVKK